MYSTIAQVFHTNQNKKCKNIAYRKSCPCLFPIVMSHLKPLPFFVPKRLLALFGVGLFVVAVPQKGVSQPVSSKVAAGQSKQTGSVQSTLKAFRVTMEKGKEVLVPATSAKPGDLIEYQARYTNGTGAPVRSLSPSLPVPEAMIYVGNTARPRGFQASVDGKKFGSAPLRRTVKGADGKSKIEFIPLSQYRVLRWNLGTLAPGASKTVSARMRLHSPAAPTGASR